MLDYLMQKRFFYINLISVSRQISARKYTTSKNRILKQTQTSSEDINFLLIFHYHFYTIYTIFYFYFPLPTFVNLFIILLDLQILFTFYFLCASPLPTSDPYWRDNLTHSIFHLHFYEGLTRRSTEVSQQGGASKLHWASSRVWTRSLWICSQCFYPLGYPAQRATLPKGLLLHVHSCKR